MAQEPHDDITDNNGGKQVGDQNDNLTGFPEQLAGDRFKRDRHRDCQKIPQNNERNVIQDRVPEDQRGVMRLGHKGKIVQPDPGTGQEAQRVVHFLEGEQKPGHGQVIIDDQVNDARQEHQIQRNKLADTCILPAALGDRRGDSLFRSLTDHTEISSFMIRTFDLQVHDIRKPCRKTIIFLPYIVSFPADLSGENGFFIVYMEATGPDAT